MVLIDTNIVSELCRRAPNRGALEWAASVRGDLVRSVLETQRSRAKLVRYCLSRSCDVLPVTAGIGQVAKERAVYRASSSRRVRRARRRIC